MVQDGCQRTSARVLRPPPTATCQRTLCQKVTTSAAGRGVGARIVENSTLRWLRAVGIGLLLVCQGFPAHAEDASSKSSSDAAKKSAHHRKPYPPLRTASGQPAASASHSTANVPPLRSSVEKGGSGEPAPSSVPAVASAKPKNTTDVPLRDASSATAPNLVFDGKGYLMVGRGQLAVSGIPPYTASLYLEHVGARAQFGSLTTRAPTRAQLMSENRAQYFVIWGRFAKLMVLKFAKPATKAELTEMFRSGMPEVFSDRAPVELHKDADSFLRLFDRDVAEGQELRLHVSEQSQIDVYFDGQKQAGPQNAKLARHVIEIWLGYHSAARSLRQVLIDKIEVLKTPVPRPPK